MDVEFHMVMKSFVLALTLISTFSLQAQYAFDRNDFFEVGPSFGTLVVDKLDISPEDKTRTRVTAENALVRYGISLRYGKAVVPFAHLVFGVGVYRGENVNREILSLNNDEIAIRTMIEYGFAYEAEFGARIKVVGTDAFEFSIGGGGLARSTPGIEDNLLVGYQANSVIGINFSERIQVNAKYGYRTTEGKRRISDFPAELALHYKIY